MGSALPYAKRRRVERENRRVADIRRFFRKAADKRMSEINQQNSTGRMPITFAAFADGLWQEHVKRIKPATASSYESILKTHLQPGLGDKFLTEITPADVTKVIAMAAEHRSTGKSLLQVYGLLNVMFQTAFEYDLIDSSPVRRKLRRPRGYEEAEGGLERRRDSFDY